MKFNQQFISLCNDRQSKALDIVVYGHNLRIPQAILYDDNRSQTASGKKGKIALFSFNELCGVALAAADYIAIAEMFDCIFVKDVPKMSLNNRNEVIYRSLPYLKSFI